MSETGNPLGYGEVIRPAKSKGKVITVMLESDFGRVNRAVQRMKHRPEAILEGCIGSEIWGGDPCPRPATGWQNGWSAGPCPFCPVHRAKSSRMQGEGGMWWVPIEITEEEAEALIASADEEGWVEAPVWTHIQNLK